MSITIPKTFRGRPIKGAMERALAKQSQAQQPVQVQPQTNAPDLDGFVYVPSINLYVAKQRTLQNHNWYNTHKELHKQGCTMPTLPQFVGFLNYLRNDHRDRQEADSILDDILTVRSPWRSEWIDAKFRQQGSEMYMDFNHRTQGDDLVAQNQEVITDYLNENKTPGISLDNWLVNSGQQGLPASNCSNGSLYYWRPIAERVARFYAYSDGAVLYCDRFPSDRGSSLGVRAVRHNASTESAS